jgi:hypothetical protein
MTLTKYAFAIVLTGGVCTQVFAAQDAGSGPTTGATSKDDAGSGPTQGAKSKVDSQATASQSLGRDRLVATAVEHSHHHRRPASTAPLAIHPDRNSRVAVRS